jgi:hypothetical protein
MFLIVSVAFAFDTMYYSHLLVYFSAPQLNESLLTKMDGLLRKEEDMKIMMRKFDHFGMS